MLHITYQPPTFTIEEASQIVSQLYGLAHNLIRPLPGERDQNFYLEAGAGQAFVLKIAHAAEQWETLDLQNKTLEHLARNAPSLLLPQVRKTVTGETIATVTAATSDTAHLVRLLTFVPGKPLAEVKPHTPELLHSLGAILGEMDKALQNFSHAAAHRTLKWDVQHTTWIRDCLHHIPQPEHRAIVEHFLAQFESQTLPIAPHLRTSIIHNDANDYNVLVGADLSRPGRGGIHVTTIIDFGDMVETYTICNLAIAAAYAMLGKADPLAAAAHVITGYHEVFPLSELELEALYPLICARLCISVVNSAYQQKEEPGNHYLTISEQPAWRLLEQLSSIPPQFAHYTFRRACHLLPSPRTHELVAWLNNNPDRIGRIVEPDLCTTDLLIFDLSIGSREMGNLENVSHVESFTHRLFELMHAAHVKVGIGRYDEARLIYTSDQFKAESNDGPEWRTLHIGLDLFMEVGSPIFAPLDGIIYGFHDNHTPLDFGPTIILQHTISDTSGTSDTPTSDLTFYTLYGHLTADSLDGLYEGMPIKQGTPIAKIGNYPINGGWPPHLHFQIIADLLGETSNFPGVARPSQREVWLSLCPDPNLIAGIPSERFQANGLSSEAIRHARATYIGPSLSVAYRKPLTIVRGYMQYLYDENGRAYLDAVNNVSHVGHSHPRVVKAGQEQMDVLNTNTRYLHDNLVRYAERLCASLPEPLRVCFFVCSGSEANELALRLARTHTQQKDLIVIDAAYHGNTTTLVEISPYKFDGPGGAGPPSYVHKVPLPDLYRGNYKKGNPQAGKLYAAYVELAISTIHEGKRGLAAFICESLLGCGGQIVLPDNYLQEAYRHVRNAGSLCIADEVQVGFGRVGTHFWGFETQGVVPDIVTLGKPIGNGHPLAAVVTTPEIAASFNNGMEYFNTFGGNPVSCAIGLAVLDVIADEQLQSNALRVGTHLQNGLHRLMEKHTLIGDVRGMGLFLGIELVADRQALTPAAPQASYIANRLSERGILLSTDGPYHNVLKIKPPLVFTEANADFLVATLDDILTEDGAKAEIVEK